MRAIQFVVDGVTVVTAHDHDREVAVLDAECERLQITCDGLDAQNDAIATENDTLRKQLTESQANDRCAMAYLADVRAVVGGTDFVCMVHNVTQMKQQLDEARELLRKAAMHVRPTCSDLYAGLDAWLEAHRND